jgi:hypothetical protein
MHRMTRHLLYRSAFISLIYHALALGVFVATFFSRLPLEYPIAFLFPLFLPFGIDFGVQIVRSAFVSGVQVFVFYLALEWLLATLLMFGIGAIRARGRRRTS